MAFVNSSPPPCAEVCQLRIDVDRHHNDIEEGKRQVLPLIVTVDYLSKSVDRIEGAQAKGFEQIQQRLDASLSAHVCQMITELSKGLILALQVVSRNDNGQIRWVAGSVVAVVAIVWGVPILFDLTGIRVGP